MIHFLIPKSLSCGKATPILKKHNEVGIITNRTVLRSVMFVATDKDGTNGILIWTEKAITITQGVPDTLACTKDFSRK